jgi:hypothetical protein
MCWLVQTGFNEAKAIWMHWLTDCPQRSMEPTSRRQRAAASSGDGLRSARYPVGKVRGRPVPGTAVGRMSQVRATPVTYRASAQRRARWLWHCVPQRADVAACEALESWMVITTTRSRDSSNRYTTSIHRQGPRMKRIPAHLPVNSGPRRGNCSSGASDPLTRCRMPGGGCA